MPHASYTTARGMVDRLRERRLALGLSQRATARRAGADEPTVYRWENGHMLPSLPYLIRWAGALGLTLMLGACAFTDRGQAAADQLGAVSVRDIDQAMGLAILNNDQPAQACLKAIRYVVTSIQAYAAAQPDGKLVVGPLTAFQMGMDITNPGGYLQTECAAQKAQVKSRVQLFLGQTATLLATFGL